uniref:Uncharacterized protein n=1 Tax=Octopus bimaculoides TaxID=37653 RepID=A0A0L8H8R2_OCTBM
MHNMRNKDLNIQCDGRCGVLPCCFVEGRKLSRVSMTSLLHFPDYKVVWSI